MIQLAEHNTNKNQEKKVFIIFSIFFNKKKLTDFVAPTAQNLSNFFFNACQLLSTCCAHLTETITQCRHVGISEIKIHWFYLLLVLCQTLSTVKV